MTLLSRSFNAGHKYQSVLKIKGLAFLRYSIFYLTLGVNKFASIRQEHDGASEERRQDRPLGAVTFHGMKIA
jgi:hypothetical protein